MFFYELTTSEKILFRSFDMLRSYFLFLEIPNVTPEVGNTWLL